MEKIVMIGAGKTGRGYIARLAAESDKALYFVDTNEELVKKLNEKGSFTVKFFGNCRPAMEISGYTAKTPDEAVIDDADLILVSVGGMNLDAVGAYLKEKLGDERTYTVITCENAASPAAKLAAVIGKKNVNVSEATVFCTTVADGELNIASENYPYLQCDKVLLKGYEPTIKGIRPIEGFENLLTRKLFTYNAASAIISYIGWYKGYTVYAEAANDPEILDKMDRNYAATNRVMCKKFGYTVEDQAEFAALSKKKFCDPTIVDTIARNAHEPQRKLGPKERIIGPLKLMFEMGEDTEILEETAACALIYEMDGEEKWDAIKANGKEYILTEICGLEKGSELFNRLLKKACELEERRK